MAYVQVDGRKLRVSSLEKVLYPTTGTTKAEVIDYYSRIAPAMLPHLARRPVTRKRWVDGVGDAENPIDSFFAKGLEAGAPEWIARGRIEHSTGLTEYPLAAERATLVYLAQMASLELHVPQWQFAPDGSPALPDRLVLDLDPGPDVGLAECAEVARWARSILDDMGMPPMPVTSGGKGLHLYARLSGEQTSEQISGFARELARALEADHKDLVVSSMTKAVRRGKVLVDWSQNNGKKTTIAPYSMRGTPEPFVAAPRAWTELEDPDLRQLRFDEVLARVQETGDLLAPVAGEGALSRYLSMRQAGVTPEPMPLGPTPRSQGQPSFVIQEHHATRLHWDLRLERDGVLVSWAVPKGVPATSDVNRLAVQTEDHPLEYGSFEGTIPKGEYGGGVVTIWDSGTYELEKWRDDEIIFTLDGFRQGTVRLVLIRTDGEGPKSTWLLRRMKTDAQGRPQASADSEGRPQAVAESDAKVPPSRRVDARRRYEPMLATMGNPGLARDLVRRSGMPAWVELKWDGVRAIAVWDGGELRLQARSGKDITARYPELTAPGETAFGAESAVLDGEIVALDANGRSDFGLLQRRMHLDDEAEITREMRRTPALLFVFDILELDGESVAQRPLAQRRELLERVADGAGEAIQIPPVFDDLDATLAAVREHNFEGVVVKDPRSPYRIGRRSEEWLKVKLTRRVEAVIGGMRQGQGGRSDTFGSLLLGVPEDDGLRYIGRVGTGFTERELRKLTDRLAPLVSDENPFESVPEANTRDAVWVRPELTAEVEFAEWTAGGILRQARWRGLK